MAITFDDDDDDDVDAEEAAFSDENLGESSTSEAIGSIESGGKNTSRLQTMILNKVGRKALGVALGVAVLLVVGIVVGMRAMPRSREPDCKVWERRSDWYSDSLVPDYGCERFRVFELNVTEVYGFGCYNESGAVFRPWEGANKTQFEEDHRELDPELKCSETLRSYDRSIKQCNDKIGKKVCKDGAFDRTLLGKPWRMPCDAYAELTRMGFELWPSWLDFESWKELEEREEFENWEDFELGSSWDELERIDRKCSGKKHPRPEDYQSEECVDWNDYEYKDYLDRETVLPSYGCETFGIYPVKITAEDGFGCYTESQGVLRPWEGANKTMFEDYFKQYEPSLKCTETLKSYVRHVQRCNDEGGKALCKDGAFDRTRLNLTDTREMSCDAYAEVADIITRWCSGFQSEDCIQMSESLVDAKRIDRKCSGKKEHPLLEDYQQSEECVDWKDYGWENYLDRETVLPSYGCETFGIFPVNVTVNDAYGCYREDEEWGEIFRPSPGENKTVFEEVYGRLIPSLNCSETLISYTRHVERCSREGGKPLCKDGAFDRTLLNVTDTREMTCDAYAVVSGILEGYDTSEHIDRRCSGKKYPRLEDYQSDEDCVDWKEYDWEDYLNRETIFPSRGCETFGIYPVNVTMEDRYGCYNKEGVVFRPWEGANKSLFEEYLKQGEPSLKCSETLSSYTRHVRRCNEEGGRPLCKDGAFDRTLLNLTDTRELSCDAYIAISLENSEFSSDEYDMMDELKMLEEVDIQEVFPDEEYLDRICSRPEAEESEDQQPECKDWEGSSEWYPDSLVPDYGCERFGFYKVIVTVEDGFGCYNESGAVFRPLEGANKTLFEEQLRQDDPSLNCSETLTSYYRGRCNSNGQGKALCKDGAFDRTLLNLTDDTTEISCDAYESVADIFVGKSTPEHVDSLCRLRAGEKDCKDWEGSGNLYPESRFRGYHYDCEKFGIYEVNVHKEKRGFGCYNESGAVFRPWEGANKTLFQEVLKLYYPSLECSESLGSFSRHVKRCSDEGGKTLCKDGVFDKTLLNLTDTREMSCDAYAVVAEILDGEVTSEQIDSECSKRRLKDL
eukprot:scaffold5156_cov143-Cylindrotheca_fusiformis.AAC.1